MDTCKSRNGESDGNARNQGGNAGNQGGNAGNQGGNTGNQGGNAGNRGGNFRNAGNVGNQGGNRRKLGENVWNQGGNAANQGDSLWESSCLLLRLKSRSARGAFHHPAFMGSYPTISHTYFTFSTKWMGSSSRKWERFYVSLVPMLGF